MCERDLGFYSNACKNVHHNWRELGIYLNVPFTQFIEVEYNPLCKMQGSRGCFEEMLRLAMYSRGTTLAYLRNAAIQIGLTGTTIPLPCVKNWVGPFVTDDYIHKLTIIMNHCCWMWPSVAVQLSLSKADISRIDETGKSLGEKMNMVMKHHFQLKPMYSRRQWQQMLETFYMQALEDDLPY